MTRSREIDEYLEKYSVAPAPSRDYYGIKVLRDQIILYTWKISHGPHTSPTVRVSRFHDFSQEKTMHNEIERVFGKLGAPTASEPMLRHIQSIAEGQETTLLTLPKYLVKKLTTYLTLKDVLKISTLSHIAKEIFDGDVVWELLYRRKKMGLVYKDEREQGSSYGWKRLFKERQMHKSARNRKKKELSGDQPLVTSRSTIKLTKKSSSTLPLKSQRGTLSTMKLLATEAQTPKSAGSLSSHNFGVRLKRNPDADIKCRKLFGKKNLQMEVKMPGEPDAKDSSIVFESRTVGGPKEKDSAKAVFENKSKSKATQKNTSTVSACTVIRTNLDKKSQSSPEKSSNFRQKSNPSSMRRIQSKAGSNGETLPVNSAKKNRNPKSGGRSGIYETRKALLDESDRGIPPKEDSELDELIRASITAEYLNSDNFLPNDFWRNRSCTGSSSNLEKGSARKFCKPNLLTNESKNFSEHRKGLSVSSVKRASTKYESRNYSKTESCDSLDSKFIPIKPATRRFGAKQHGSLTK